MKRERERERERERANKMPDQDAGEQTIDYASMVENASDMIVRFDTELQHIFCNKAVEQQLGVPREFFLGKTPRELGSPSEQIEFITQSLQKTIESGEEQEVEQSYPTPDGILYFQTRIIPEFDSSGSVKSLLAISRSITSQKSAEHRLLESEKRFKSIFADSPIGIELYDDKGQLIEVNQACLNIFGVSNPLELKGFSLFDDPNLSDENKARLRKAETVRYEVPFSFEKVKEHYLYQTNKSGIAYLDLIITPLKQGDNIVYGYLVQVQDITKRIWTEKVIAESEEKFRMLFNMETDFLALIEAGTGNMLEVNQSFVDHYGYTRDEVLTMKNTDFSAEPDKTRKASQGRDARIPIRWHKKKDGTVFPTEIVSNTTYYQGREAHIVAIRDITERRQIEQALNESEERLSLSLRGTNAGVWDWFIQSGRTVFNERWAEIIGYTLEELEPVSIETWAKYTHPEDLKKSNELLEKHFSGELGFYEGEVRMKHKNGEWVWVLDRGMISEWGEDGKPVRVTGTHVDITQNKKAELDLLLFKSIVECSNMAIAISDPNGQLYYINPAHVKLFGRTLEEARNLNYRDYYPLESLEILSKEVAPALERGSGWEGELEVFNINGRVFPLWEQADSIFDESGNMLFGFGIMQDITKRKQAEAQIKSSLKEKETLLQEIHHRVKNNMTVISSLLKLQMNSLDNKEAKEALQDSQNRVQSMSMIHETLYRSDNLSAIDLKTYLSELGGTIFQNYSISNKVQFKVEAENITIGAKQASPVGLIVNELISNCLKYAFTDDREGEILLKLKSNNENGVELIVSDNGVGIPEAFDLQKADSLGLKLVKMLAENQLDGSLDMESNNGTKFTIKFNTET